MSETLFNIIRTNDRVAPTAALHVYGGDFYSTPRTMWSGETYEPLTLDTDLVEKTLAAAAARARLADAPGERP